MPENVNRRPLTNAEKQKRHRARVKAAHYKRVPDTELLAEAVRRGLLLPDHLSITGTHTQEGDAR